jgi:hypothetical protein
MWADLVMRRVELDRIPGFVASFSELHDHVDANVYLIDIVGPDFPQAPEDAEIMFSDEDVAASNAVSNEVSLRLAARAASWPSH